MSVCATFCSYLTLPLVYWERHTQQQRNGISIVSSVVTTTDLAVLQTLSPFFSRSHTISNNISLYVFFSVRFQLCSFSVWRHCPLLQKLRTWVQEADASCSGQTPAGPTTCPFVINRTLVFRLVQNMALQNLQLAHLSLWNPMCMKTESSISRKFTF